MSKKRNKYTKKSKKDVGRTLLYYLEALQEARFKIMDGSSKQDALKYAESKFKGKLKNEEILQLRNHIRTRGAL